MASPKFQEPPTPIFGRNIWDYTYAGWFEQVKKRFDLLGACYVELRDPFWGVYGETYASAGLRAVSAAIQELGGGVTVDFRGLEMAIFEGENDSTPESLFSLSGCDGLRFVGGGCNLAGVGNFHTDAIRGIIFDLTNCTNVTWEGAFRATYTGDRLAGGANAGVINGATERRGLVFAKLTDTCVGIRSSLLTVNDYSVPFWFHTDVGNDITEGSSDIDLGTIVATDVGYGLLTHRSGHGIRAYIESNRCGRSGQIQDTVGGFRLTFRSKNHTAGNDVGFSGDLDGEAEYINVDSTTAGELGRCVGIHYTVADSAATRKCRRMALRFNIKTNSGTGTYFTTGVRVGLAPGTNASDVDNGYVVENMTLSGRVESHTGSMQMFVVESPLTTDVDTGTWTAGQNLKNVRLEDIELNGSGTVSVDLAGVVDQARLDNVTSDVNLQLIGNTVGKITCIGLKAPETTTSTSDTSRIDYVSSNITTGSTLSKVNSNLVNTYVNGVLHGVENAFTTSVSTTDATTTTLATIAIPSSTTVLIEAKVYARRTGGTAGSAEDAAGYLITACYKNVGGAATEVGETAVFTAEDQAGWAATITASSGNALIRVTGAVDNNVDWKATYKVSAVS